MMDGYVYFIMSTNKLVKIGVTKNVDRRLSELQTGSPGKMKLLGFIKTTKPYDLEKRLHKKYKDLRISGEWFNIHEVDVELEMLINNKLKIEDFGNNYKDMNFDSNSRDEQRVSFSENKTETLHENKLSIFGWDNNIHGIYLESWENDSHVLSHMVFTQTGVDGYLVYSLENLHGQRHISVEAIKEIPEKWELVWELKRENKKALT